jgi:hypothetical protein
MCPKLISATAALQQKMVHPLSESQTTNQENYYWKDDQVCNCFVYPLVGNGASAGEILCSHLLVLSLGLLMCLAETNNIHKTIRSSIPFPYTENYWVQQF